MGAIDYINQRLIKLFSFENKSKEVTELNTFYGQKWENMKTDNKTINSIFANVDNGDGIVQPQELNILTKIFNYIDNLHKKDEILDEKEINEFNKQLKNGTITLDKIKNQEEKAPQQSWSEGLDRNITSIQLAKSFLEREPQLKQELQQIGDEQGFTLTETDGENIWIEDTSIRRADGKIYIPYHSFPEDYKESPEVSIKSQRNNENNTGQGRVLDEGSAFDVQATATEKHYGTSYLEGGNVLNTKLKDGTPAAVVGESSIAYTLELMGLEQTPENIEKAKGIISEDLGLTKDQVTFIPQHDFHIDMSYRPLHNGQFAIPDYEKGLEILKQFQKDINIQDTTISENASQEEIITHRKAYKLNKKINKLEKLVKESKSIYTEAEDYLKEAGYETVKIPCFTTSSNDQTNFMNGIGGTSNKTGETFYITNKSEFPELQEVIEKYLKDAGIDKLYFVSTQAALDSRGGIDCLTQEQ